VRLAGRRDPRRAARAGRIRRGARDPPDHRRRSAAGLSACRVRAREGLHRPHRASQADARGALEPAGILLALDARFCRRRRRVSPFLPRRAPLGTPRQLAEPVTHSTLQGALEALYGLERRKDKLGLDGTRALLAALGNPERRFRSVHVAGTNGKGSTCALIERALREAGHRTGLFTSPHLVDFRERIRVNGRWADEAWLFEKLEHLQSLPEG